MLKEIICFCSSCAFRCSGAAAARSRTHQLLEQSSHFLSHAYSCNKRPWCPSLTCSRSPSCHQCMLERSKMDSSQLYCGRGLRRSPTSVPSPPERRAPVIHLWSFAPTNASGNHSFVRLSTHIHPPPQLSRSQEQEHFCRGGAIQFAHLLLPYFSAERQEIAWAPTWDGKIPWGSSTKGSSTLAKYNKKIICWNI